MTERIDHAAEARRRLEAVITPVSALSTAGQAERVAAAQVHATLALVEQQRLANLIEVAKWNSRVLVTGARRVGDEPVDHDREVARVDAIFAEVQKGLGL